MRSKLGWPPSELDDLDRTMIGGITAEWITTKWDKRRDDRFKPATDDELDDLVDKIEREEFANV